MKQKKPVYKRVWVGILAVILLAGVIGSLGENGAAKLARVVEIKLEHVVNVVDFETKRIDDPTLNKGTEVVSQEGVNGEFVTTYKIIYTNNRETDRLKINENTKTEKADKIIKVGTKDIVAEIPKDENKSPSPPSNEEGAQEYYKNCTELRKEHPKGVPSTHPAYRPQLDRDKDSWACEVSG